MYIKDFEIVKGITIGDFGISSTIKDSTLTPTIGRKTLAYSAPELLASKLFGKESDWYSIGITILELLTDYNPYKNLTEHQIVTKQTTEKITIPQN